MLISAVYSRNTLTIRTTTTRSLFECELLEFVINGSQGVKQVEINQIININNLTMHMVLCMKIHYIHELGMCMSHHAFLGQ